MFYDDFFTRIEDIENFNKNTYNIKITGKYSDERAKNLFQDCFSNHVDFDNPHNDKLKIEIVKNSTRVIQRDILTSYFINKIYTPPKIYEKQTGNEISFEGFVSNIIENSYVEEIVNHTFSLGSNRLRFLIGDVGEGKSALVKKVISEIRNNYIKYDEKYSIIPIYINFENVYNYSNKASPLKDDFLEFFYITLQETLCSRLDLSEIVNTCNIKIAKELVIKKIFNLMKNKKIRLVIFMDNLDFYHYHTSKYAYFQEYYEKQIEMLDENIMWLYNYFSSKEFLGDQGLNVLFCIRQYVYEDIISRQNGIDTEIGTTIAYKISLVNEDEVLSSRFQLMKDSIDQISSEYKILGENLLSLYNEFKILVDINSIEMESLTESKEFLNNKIKIHENSPIKQISRIGQHGYRTLVHFFSSLNISYLDVELLYRFFNTQASVLRLVYFTNIYQRYTQEKDHFPNIFLNDCVITYKEEFRNAHKNHAHTYWLKYFILKYIARKNEVRVRKILDIFHILGNYDEHLVLHVIGSLGTANEFRCIECNTNTSSENIESRKLIATNRGKYFNDVTSFDVEHCFDIEYLQVAIEDKWLSIPKELINELYNNNLNYSHVYDTGKKYIDNSINHAYEKAKNCLYFLKIIEDSYKIEIQKNKSELHEILVKEKLVPDLEKAREKIIQSVIGIIKAFKRDEEMNKIESLETIKQELEDRDFSKFFTDYYTDMTDNKKVR